MERRQENIFNVLNEWFDISQTSFLAAWPELEEAVRTPDPSDYGKVIEYLEEHAKLQQNSIDWHEQRAAQHPDVAVYQNQAAEARRRDKNQIEHLIRSARVDRTLEEFRGKE